MEHGGRWRRNASRLVWTLDLSCVSRGKATREGAVVWRTAMFGVVIYSIPSMSQCECGRLWDPVSSTSQCVTYALLSPTL